MMISQVVVWSLWLLLGWCLSAHRLYVAAVLLYAGLKRDAYKCLAWAAIHIFCFLGFAFMGQYVLGHCRSCPHPSSRVFAGGCWGDQTFTYQAFYVLHYVFIGVVIIRWLADGPCSPPIRNLIRLANKHALEEAQQLNAGGICAEAEA